MNRRKFVFNVIVGGTVIAIGVPSFEAIASVIPTSLDRVNIRRAILYVQKMIEECCEVQMLEPNDSITWVNFTNHLTSVLQGLKDRKLFLDFAVVCNESTNTPDLMDKGEFNGKVILKFARMNDHVQLKFMLKGTSILGQADYHHEVVEVKG